MSFTFTLLTGFPNLLLPTFFGWFVWLGLLGWTVFLFVHWRGFQHPWTSRSWGLFIGLLFLVPVTSLFIGVRLASGSALPLPNFPTDYSPGSTLMLFSGVPWILAGSFLGPLSAALLGLAAGILRGVWDTYSLFTAVELAAFGILFSIGVRQRYRTAIYQLVRQPLLGALLLIPLHLVFFVVGEFLSLPADLSAAARLDFALSNAGVTSLAFGGEMIVAGMVAQLAAAAFPSVWGEKTPLQPSPAERSLETRFVYAAGTFIVVLLLTLLIGDWVVAGQAASGLLKDRLASVAEAQTRNVPFFFETGQNLAAQLASDPRMLASNPSDLDALLAQRTQAVPYFDQIFVLDSGGKNLLGAYPASAGQNFSLYPSESNGIALAAKGVLNQIYTLPGSDLPRVSFLVAVTDGSGQVQRVLLGRTSLLSNPLTQSLVTGLKGFSKSDLAGDALLLDEDGNVIYHSGTGNKDAAPYTGTGSHSDQPSFSSLTAADGTRELAYYQPVEGYPWAVVLTVPASQTQQLALTIAMPMFVMIILVGIMALLLLRVGLRMVTGSLQSLAVEANRIAHGQLDHPLQITGADEVGQLRGAFEQMRASLAARLDELNRLLVVSRGVASSLEMRNVVKPVLDAVASTGANAVQVALLPSLAPESTAGFSPRFSVGPAKDSYKHLDEQLLAMAQREERILFPNLGRTRELSLDPKRPTPGALLAVPLRHESRYYGVLWASYEQPRGFSEADVRFVATIAGQASLAIANAHLFMNVEVARRQLEAILNSTPDPVLVTDQRNRLLLANRAAEWSFEIHAGEAIGKLINEVVVQKPLVELLLTSSEKQSVEVLLPDDRTYLATASSVTAEGRLMGRVCILRDVTSFKEIDTMKSEFVATVSHDLRSPLTLMRGYATMLEMVGNLNEQQQGYIRKIVSGIENMSRLINNLLDLGRIEGGVGLQVQEVPVLDVLERATALLQLQAAEKKVALDMEISKTLPATIEADPALLHQAIYNLIENAIKYTPANGSVTVRVQASQADLLFEVEDTGIGINPEDLPRLFEKFYRGKQREARAQHGSGLGLAIVNSIVGQHHGRVRVESQLGKGSTFFLQIPLRQPRENPRA